MIGTLFSAKQLVRRIQNQLIKTLDKAVNRELEKGTYNNETNGVSSMLHKSANFFLKIKNGWGSQKKSHPFRLLKRRLY